MKEITISKQESGITIYKFVKKVLNNAPISAIEKIFRLKDVKVNDVRVKKDYVIKENDNVKIYVSDQMIEDFSVQKKKNISKHYKLDIVYEDENIIIVNKPTSLLVHGDEQEKEYTLTNIVNDYLISKEEINPQSTFTCSPCHRLDRNTSGLVIFAKKTSILQEFEELFKDRDNISKYYLALVKGITPKSGTINKNLLKDEKNKMVRVVSSNEGKTAITKYELVETFNYCSLVRIELLTGRTHQIRVHMASIGHPLLGDKKYGDFALNKKFEKEFNYNHQFLHAEEIKFDKLNGELEYLSYRTYNSKLPEKENNIIESLRSKRHDI